MRDAILETLRSIAIDNYSTIIIYLNSTIVEAIAFNYAIASTIVLSRLSRLAIVHKIPTVSVAGVAYLQLS